MFTAVPPRYDIINHIITLGMDTRWRKLAARTCVENNPHNFLDIGCGTGDLSIAVALLGKPDIKVTGLDYSAPMLIQAKEKAKRAGLAGIIEFVHGQADNLPFQDRYFDSVGITFAFRNLTYKNPLVGQHLAEILRVLKPGGRFVIVESSQPRPRPCIVKWLHRFYVRNIVYRLGWLVSGNKEAYKYLSESALNYYGAEELQSLLTEAGFSRVTFQRLMLGAAAVHVAVK